MFYSFLPNRYKPRQIQFPWQVLSFILLFHMLGQTDSSFRTTLPPQGVSEVKTNFMLTLRHDSCQHAHSSMLPSNESVHILGMPFDPIMSFLAYFFQPNVFITFSCCVSLMSFNWEQVLRFSCLLMMLTFHRVQSHPHENK